MEGYSKAGTPEGTDIRSRKQRGGGDQAAGRPWLTVLLPTYNRIQFLRGSLERLVQQVEMRDWDVQVVVSDNWSIDGTSEFLAAFQRSHSFIELVRPPVHRPSAEANIAFALDFCRGEHVWILGDDDYILNGALDRIRSLLDFHKFDFFLFNNKVFYVPERIGNPMIPMIGTLQECPIAEIIARLGFIMISASITSAVSRTDKLRAALPRFVDISPYFAHVAAYLQAFQGASCGFGGEPIAVIREAASVARVAFGEVIALADVRSAGPWGFGIALLIERLLGMGAVEDDFLPSVVELGHDRRFRLLHFVLIHCLRQIQAWARTGRPSEAVSEEDLAAIRRVCRNLGPSLHEVINRMAEIVSVLSAVHGGANRSAQSGPFGPPLRRLLADMQRQGSAIEEAVGAWACREADKLEAPLQNSLTFGQEREVVAEHGDYKIIRAGIDYIAVRRDLVGRIEEVCDLTVVNPIEAPPRVLIGRSVQSLIRRIEGGAGGPETFLSKTIFHFHGGAVAVGGNGAAGEGILVARSLSELRDKILIGHRQSGRADQSRADVLATLRDDNRFLFDPAWYASTYQLRFAGQGAAFFKAALNHYLTKGLPSGLSPSVWFDEIWYCDIWAGGRAEIRAAGYAGGLEHFLKVGATKLLTPSALLDTGWYFGTYPAARERIMGGTSRHAMQDYLAFGRKEGASLSPFFEEAWYLKRHPDIRARVAAGEFLSGLHYYLLEGRSNGHDPGPAFSESAYLDAYPDVAEAIAKGYIPSGYDHWMRHGRAEGRSALVPGGPTLSGLPLA